MTAQQDVVNHRTYRRPDRTTNTRYDDKDKLFALAVYAETGSLVTSSKRTGIPDTTIQSWVKNPENDAILEELRSALRHKIAFICAEGALLAAEQIVDRIKNGEDVIVNNEIQRMPVKAKDLGYLLGVMSDRHTMYTATGNAKNSKDALTNLATELVKKMRQITEPKVIDQDAGQ